MFKAVSEVSGGAAVKALYYISILYVELNHLPGTICQQIL